MVRTGSFPSLDLFFSRRISSREGGGGEKSWGLFGALKRRKERYFKQVHLFPSLLPFFLLCVCVCVCVYCTYYICRGPGRLCGPLGQILSWWPDGNCKVKWFFLKRWLWWVCSINLPKKLVLEPNSALRPPLSWREGGPPCWGPKMNQQPSSFSHLHSLMAPQLPEKNPLRRGAAKGGLRKKRRERKKRNEKSGEIDALRQKMLH